MRRWHSTSSVSPGWAALLLAVCVVLSACGAGNKAEAQALAENFLADIRVGAWHAAYGRMHADLQAACGSPSGLNQRVQAMGVQPQDWAFESVSAFNHTGYIVFTLTDSEGTTRYANLELVRDSGEFLIRNWRTDAEDLCGEV